MHIERFAAASLLGGLLAFGACDLGKTVSQLGADELMVGTLLSTPTVNVEPGAWVSADGGVPDGGSVQIPGQTTASLFFGKKNGPGGLEAPPSPIDGAEATLVPAGKSSVPLPGGGSGTYGVTSVTEPSFTYESGVDYRFRAIHDGETFEGEIQQVPPLENIPALHPAKGYIEHTSNTALSINRPAPASGADRNPVFVTVVPLASNGDKGEPTFSNVPTTPLDFLKLVAIPDEWKTATVAIPASAFPNKASTYLLIFQAVKLGGPATDNLFTGSALLAGAADVGVLQTAP